MVRYFREVKIESHKSPSITLSVSDVELIVGFSLLEYEYKPEYAVFGSVCLEILILFLYSQVSSRYTEWANKMGYHALYCNYFHCPWVKIHEIRYSSAVLYPEFSQ